LLSKHLGRHPVVAVIYSHSHVDHYGGVRGIVSEQDVTSGKVQILAPEGFLEHAISENVIAGNAMSRRAIYMFGGLIPPGPKGAVSAGLGVRGSAGSIGLIPPTREVTKTGEEIVIDGVRMVFQLTPGTEAPAEMNTFFPDKRAMWMAENTTAVMHNVLTLRGALVRDAKVWAQYIDETIRLYGDRTDVVFQSHHWPRWGNARVQEVLRAQRDLYAHLNNQVLHLANQGVTINEIHNVYRLPPSLQKHWAARSYHGSEQHNSRAVINRYLGYWDGNPSTLIPLAPKESAPLFVEMMGGADAIVARAQQLMDGGLVGNVVANDRAGDADGVGLGVVLFAEDVPNFNHVPQLLKRAAGGVGRHGLALSAAWRSAAPFWGRFRGLFSLQNLHAIMDGCEVAIPQQLCNCGGVGHFDSHITRKHQPKEPGFRVVAKVGEGWH
jgi:alkyl sulfatase BDS1-like metallo-beta-lactamase superfamily hydrolase